MTPYYSHAGIEIYHGDCRDLGSAVLPASVDVVLADPPYGDTSLAWDERELHWLTATGATVKAGGSVWCFGSMRMFMAQAAAIDALGWRYAQDVVWEKHNGSNFLADRFRRVHEHAVQFYRRSEPWGGVFKSPVMVPGARAKVVRRKERPAHTGHIENSTYESTDGGPLFQRSVISVRSCHGHALHPTQKPIGILIPLLAYSCPPGGLVLDPTMGVGSTLVAAKQLGLRAIGIEINERDCEKAAGRLAQEVLPLTTKAIT